MLTNLMQQFGLGDCANFTSHKTDAIFRLRRRQRKAINRLIGAIGPSWHQGCRPSSIIEAERSRSNSAGMVEVGLGSAPTHFVVQARANGKWTTVLRFQNQNEAAKAYRSYSDSNAEAVRLGAGSPIDGKLKWAVTQQRDVGDGPNVSGSSTRRFDWGFRLDSWISAHPKLAQVFLYSVLASFGAGYITGSHSGAESQAQSSALSDNNSSERVNSEAHVAKESKNSSSSTATQPPSFRTNTSNTSSVGNTAGALNKYEEAIDPRFGRKSIWDKISNSYQLEFQVPQIIYGIPVSAILPEYGQDGKISGVTLFFSMALTSDDAIKKAMMTACGGTPDQFKKPDFGFPGLESSRYCRDAGLTFQDGTKKTGIIAIIPK